MSRKVSTILVTALASAVVLLFLAGPGFAAPPGGGHGGGGGGHSGGAHPSGGGGHYGGYHGGYGGYHGYGWGYPYGGFGIGLGIGLGLGYDPYFYDVYRPTIINVVPYAGDPAVYSAPASAPAARPAPAADRAYMMVQLPVSQGEVWIEGEKTVQDKAAQEYVSPQLTPGKKYYYEVRAKWTANGKQYEAKRAFPIYPGKPVLVDFTEPAEAPSEK